MTKGEFIEAVLKASKTECTKACAEAILNSGFDVIKKDVKKGNRFIYPGFGIFSLKKRKARKGRNPQTGEEIKIKASKSVGFKLSKTFKDSL